MENANAREFASLQLHDAAWERLRSIARPAVCDVEAPGIGERRFQLIVCASFEYEDEPAWEVRQFHDKWWLFRSEVVESWPNVQLIGFRPVLIEPSVLVSFFERISGLSLPIAPDRVPEGIDGKIWQLAVFGDMCSECRLQWWSEPPAQWKPLADLAAEMLEEFAAAERRTG